MPQILAYAADILMILASGGAAIYCLILSRRLNRLTSFDKGIGGAIAVLSAQVDDMKAALSQAKAGSDGAGRHLSELVVQARDISGELELMIAACHDFAEEALVVQGQAPEPAAAQSPEPSKPEAETTADEGVEPPADEPLPVFGSRRMATAAPVFRHAATVDAAE